VGRVKPRVSFRWCGAPTNNKEPLQKRPFCSSSTINRAMRSFPVPSSIIPADVAVRALVPSCCPCQSYWHGAGVRQMGRCQRPATSPTVPATKIICNRFSGMFYKAVFWPNQSVWTVCQPPRGGGRGQANRTNRGMIGNGSGLGTNTFSARPRWPPPAARCGANDRPAVHPALVLSAFRRCRLHRRPLPK